MTKFTMTQGNATGIPGDPYDEGWNAARARDEGLASCPYEEGTEQYEQWWLGFEESLDAWEVVDDDDLT